MSSICGAVPLLHAFLAFPVGCMVAEPDGVATVQANATLTHNTCLPA